MYVTLAGRGRRSVRASLAELERLALVIGVERFVLELGSRQPEALHIYHRAGYVECAPWGEFVGRELSICMQKVPTER